MFGKPKKFWLSLALPLAVGGLAALLSGGMGDFKNMQQPPLSPPGWVFPIVWTILYLLMGYSAYRVYSSEKPQAQINRALTLYGIQLALNFIWPIVFFGFHAYLLAFFVLILLWGAIFLTMRAFASLDETASDLLIPYILWVTFAGYLNIGVYFLN